MRNSVSDQQLRWFATVLCSTVILAGIAIAFSPDSAVRADETQSPSMSAATMPTAAGGPKDIVATATGPGMQDVSTLVKAIQAAGLVDALKGPGPFTVFAPTNDAFQKLPPGKLASLMQPDHQQELATILKYHVVPGNFSSKEIMGLTEIKTLDREKTLKIQALDERTLVNEARITKADIKCSNGTIHWIDTVLMPG